MGEPLAYARLKKEEEDLRERELQQPLDLEMLHHQAVMAVKRYWEARRRRNEH